MKIKFCLLLSLLQLLKRCTATYSEKPQTNASFMGKLVPNNWNQCKSTLKAGFFNETVLFSRNFPPTIEYESFLTAMGLSCVSMKTLKNHERMELSWANNVYNTEFSVENRLEHGLPI